MARKLPLIVLAVSLLVIAGVLTFQYGVGLVPCELCVKERWPWYSAVVLAILFVAKPSILSERIISILFAALFAASAALAFYHVGVERGFFAGPSSCTAPAFKATTIEDLTRQLMATPPVRCDEVQWSLAGISLAGWNLLASLAVVAVALLSNRRSPS